MKKLIIVILIFSFTGIFAAELGLHQIAPTAGFILPEDDWEAGFQLGAVANIGKILEDKIGLFPVVSYWSSQYKWGPSNSTYDITMSNIKIGLDGHYDLSEKIEGVYAGAGLAINRLKIESPTYYTDGYGTSSHTDTEIGLSILGGYNLTISDYPCFIEGRFDLISDLNTLGVKFGMFFDL